MAKRRKILSKDRFQLLQLPIPIQRTMVHLLDQLRAVSALQAKAAQLQWGAPEQEDVSTAEREPPTRRKSRTGSQNLFAGIAVALIPA